MKTFLIALLSLAAVGCANSPHTVVNASPAELRKVPASSLLYVVGYQTMMDQDLDKELKVEFLRRFKKVSEKDLMDSYKGKLRIGMPEPCAYIFVCYATSKPPSVNTTNINGRESHQYVGHGYKRLYVYTRNGKVTGWQN